MSTQHRCTDRCTPERPQGFRPGQGCDTAVAVKSTAWIANAAVRPQGFTARPEAVTLRWSQVPGRDVLLG